MTAHLESIVAYNAAALTGASVKCLHLRIRSALLACRMVRRHLRMFGAESQFTRDDHLRVYQCDLVALRRALQSR